VSVDLISREQAIAVVAGLYGYDENHPDIDRAIAGLRALPAIAPLGRRSDA